MQETSKSDAEEQTRMLRESAADFVKRSTDMAALRKRRGTLPGYDKKQLRQMAEMGWFGILVPEAYGGLGLGFAEMAVVQEELGKGLMGDPLVPSVLAARVLHHSSNETLKERLLPGLADASALPCVAWQENLGGLNAAAIETRARTTQGGVVISGRKRFVAGAADASGYIVSALSDEGLALYWVDAAAPGVSLAFEWRADETPSGVLNLTDVAVTSADMLTPAGAQALAAIERAIEEAAVIASSEMLGVMQGSLQMALGYMRTRVQFGKAIGSFQALQHKASDLYVQQELARAVLDDAVHELDNSTAARLEQSKLASRCKSRSSDAGLRVTREVIQLHGAIGYTDEYDAGLYLKRALVLSAWLGNCSAHRRRFAELTKGVVTV